MSEEIDKMTKVELVDYAMKKFEVKLRRKLPLDKLRKQVSELEKIKTKPEPEQTKPKQSLTPSEQGMKDMGFTKSNSKSFPKVITEEVYKINEEGLSLGEPRIIKEQ